jgi:putative copper export protein/mono/diheme cytochrome c family protein
METLLIAARWVHYASTIALGGEFAFLSLVAGPAFRRAANDPAAASLRRQFAWLGWASLGLALASGAAWLAATSSTMAGAPLAALWSQGILWTVLTRTRFGQVWLLRLIFAALLGCCLLARIRRRERMFGPVNGIALVLSAALLATLAWAGHGAATPGRPGDLHLVADILHLLAAGLWLGTLIPLALLLSAARQAGRTAVARVATRRFSAMAAASVAVLLATGLVNTWFLAGTVPALLGSAYGRLLLAKIAIFGAMVMLAAVNLLRLSPGLAAPAARAIAVTLGQLRRNALAEAGGGLAALGIVGVLGTLPPGLHSEPGWPLPFRVDTAELGGRAEIILVVLALLFAAFLVAGVVFAAAGRYRRAAAAAAGLALCLGLAWLPLRAAVEPAYPTTYYAPTEPYAAPSVARGRPLYAENCALCHGAGGAGDGPAAAGLAIRPADLTAAHLLAHPLGDLFWWISHGRGNGAMPGFAAIISPERRWDLINFLRARAAGVLSRRLGPTITAAAALPLPDFAFERNGRQQSLAALLQQGPVLLILFVRPAPAARLAQLAAARRQLAAVGLAVVAVDLGEPPVAVATAPPLVAAAAADAVASLRLFAPVGRGRASELLLDRAGYVRARWASDGAVGLADPAALAAAAESVARFPAAAPRHAGHAE